MPLHADIQVRARSLGLDVLTPIIWHKIANGVTEAQGNGAGFYGKPYQPGAVVKNDIEFILFLRKGGEYRKAMPLQKALSMLTKERCKPGGVRYGPTFAEPPRAITRPPPVLAERLIKMFSFAGDTVLDPFAGTASTAMAAVTAGRHSISCDIEPAYIDIALDNLRTVTGSGA